jgi:glycosyltransferase involved in cell wall biosynthesis
MTQARKSLVVEGWRGINHSFALVNQFQLLELVGREDIQLAHVDAPFYFPHWNRATNGVGFHDSDEALLSQIPGPPHGLVPDWTYRIFSTVDLRPNPLGGRLAVFLVTELGLDPRSFVTGSDIKEFEAAGNLIVTPSHWSRNRIIDWGFQADTVRVIPHGASANYFFPLQAETIRSQRAALGFQEDEILLLNIGAAIWNKGIDVLLHGFALARQQRKDLRLVFKDQRNTYGLSGENYVQTTLSNAGLLSNDVLNAITLIPANLTMDQMNAMYGIADCYVSPYRAEGFNLPALEAMTCGTPLVVTRGGATEDFVGIGDARMIEATPFHNTVVQGKAVSGYCEPNLEHLVQLLVDTPRKPLTGATGQGGSSATLGWGPVVDHLIQILE